MHGVKNPKRADNASQTVRQLERCSRTRKGGGFDTLRVDSSTTVARVYAAWAMQILACARAWLLPRRYRAPTTNGWPLTGNSNAACITVSQLVIGVWS